MILHGEHVVKSRKALQDFIDQYRAQNKTIERLDAKKLQPIELKELAGSSSLFGTEKVLIIDELHSLPTSARKKELITLIDTVCRDIDIILWEKRDLTATMLKQFAQKQDQQFKASNSVFTWLDLIGNKDTKKVLSAFQTALSQEDEYFCFLMFIRQIRLLIQAKDGSPIKGPPFMISKLKSQAQRMTVEKLISIHQRLADIDLQTKQSRLRTTLVAELDLLQLQLSE